MFDNSHLYAGSIGKILFPVSSRSAYLEIDIEFTDGIIAKGDMEVLNDKELILNVYEYVTASGTKMSKKSWFLKKLEENIWKVDKKYSEY
ncbi:hypothetical protein SAMN05421692_0075 [Chryseobacterium indologenes]|nr:hypothetical protein EG342_23070 [Chryseobacterium lactis]SFI55154.1 hypothetical protein SAMN05421692_0075 [Chryseobacterium indologenes]SUX50708.1 Uncharacterised protein [Chryseobacterium indologenes]